ncbi:Na+/Pi-cotransporter [Luminiphilus syltensis NOR5-1B]|uniref:Na+/Pi-cotransporter n=1 Tax=Luminiphilus syltensis NOR5-1B TaxID=565045 RepID=B8KRF1_9GAMM|nr:Na/Pi symporter [Luminiphilus syltensis]EED34743.1 Na+/Pi-cotransporter [Luminiphilus syltensis NOR5-1B]
MIRIINPILLCGLAYALWLSPDFLEIATGIALFMFGMFSLEKGFRFFAGGPLEAVLRISTDRLWKSVGFGVVTTSLMQSSSLVSLITVSFVSSEMITLSAGIGIIMGANIGTTTGAWLIAGLGLKVDIAAYAMPILVFGTLFRLRRNRSTRAWGSILLGFSFLFLGIHYMKTGFESLQSTIDLSAYAISGLRGVLIYTLVGTAVTVVMQSSHATLMIIITALSAGQVSYENALALAIGANLGSTATIILGSFSANVGGKRLAVSHVIFNVTSAAIAIVFLDQFALMVDSMARFIGVAADDYLLRLALFHTLFNVLGVVVFWPLVNPLAAVLTRWVNTRPKGREYPRYLFNDALETPATAIEAVRKEVEHLLDNTFALCSLALSLKRSTIDGEESLAVAVQQTRRVIPLDVDDAYEDKIKGLYGEIVSFVGRAQLRENMRQAGQGLYELRDAGRSIVVVVKGVKHLHKNLTRYGLSANPAVRQCYDQIRFELAELLRDCRAALAEDAYEVALLAVDAIAVKQQQHSQRLTEMLDDFIRQQRMPPSIATSLMNDSDYAQEIRDRLLKAIRVLRQSHWEISATEMQLTDEDISELADQSSTDSAKAQVGGSP